VNIIDKFAPLDEIAHEIGVFCRRWGRISVSQTKEKYGTVRVYCGFGYYSLHSLIFPGWVYKHPKFPKWLWSLDIYYLSSIIGWFHPILYRYQTWIYSMAYWKQIKKYPHLFDEITGSMDWPEHIGFYIPTLCSECSAEGKFKRAYLGNETNCEICNEALR
jgi:hypothetical protein